MTFSFGNRKQRDILLQAVFLAVILTMLLIAVMTTRRNLEIQGLSVGWSFLNYATGSSIVFSLIDYDLDSSFARALLVGFINTLFLGTISVSLAVLLGTVIGTARLSSHKLVKSIAGVYVQIFRNIPLILQAFFWYAIFVNFPSPRQAIAVQGGFFISNRGIFFPMFNIEAWYLLAAIALFIIGSVISVTVARRTGRGSSLVGILISLALACIIGYAGRLADTPLFDMPQPKGLRFLGGGTMTPELGSAIVAIALFGASYVAEIVRAGFLSIPAGLIEAAHALGLGNWHIFWRIRLPLMIRRILPTMTNQIIWLMKATTIGIAIGFPDYFGVVANSINHSGQTISLIFLLIIGFWAINMTISFTMNAINRALALPGHKK
ncbi:His/Glu/Gln/Arg/opine family amino acid ABC transporter permease subunit [Sinorhizobium kostiense]|uniref:His/Glu/Gln/Arg/opine family amino acid ABC transporter permease subunit n=1 Tax=Sinorhizobium kostiense TaxID=76747 RepID=A0ABS4R0U4_9HYPH|nr:MULTISPECIES: ABC transporter permease subunit [Sinorhizobium]MBP2236500.1 His/Glu/Gln/Arg/opine family amino acid ABC transporter permease subunit [Sinorhizobium kostiense]